MNLTIRQLEILVTAADCDSFSAAAARLGITQPSLSETIRRIEAELGLPLFVRSARTVSLTADGRHAVAVARDFVRDFRGVLDQMTRRKAGGLRQRVTIAALPSIVCAVLPGALARFTRDHDTVDVVVRDVLHERAVELVREGLADIALTIRPARPGAVTFAELWSDAVHLVCRADHPLAARARVDWAELAHHRFIAMADTSSVRRLTDAAFLQCEAAVEPIFEVEQVASAVALVKAGLGVTALPALTLRMFDPGGLALPLLAEPEIRRHVGAVTLAGRALRAPAAALLRYLTDP